MTAQNMTSLPEAQFPLQGDSDDNLVAKVMHIVAVDALERVMSNDYNYPYK